MRFNLAGVIAMLFATFAISCSNSIRAADDLPKPKIDLPASTQPTASAVFAAGCFWCSEAVFERVAGVIDVVSGYAGGTKETATYEQTGSGKTGHAESIKITYDPKKITYGELLRIMFTTSEPTQKDRQGPDWGHQYRSAIFYETEDQKRVAQAYVDQLNEAKVYDKPIATTIEPLTGFYPAEEYHQDFVQHHPDHPYVRQWSLPKVQKLKEHFPSELKEPAAK
jgi:peptide-methionine (S)-S-oxide reductase